MSSLHSELDGDRRPPNPLQSGLISPRHGAGVCPRCFDFTERRRGLCRNCTRNGDNISAFAPISYSIGGEILHRQISTYKRRADPSVPAASEQLAQLLHDFLTRHEACLATAAGVRRFDIVTTVPSGSARPARDNHHPLRDLVWAIPSLRSRCRRNLYPGLHRGAERVYDPFRYFAFANLDGAGVLLIDDLWTTGSSAQSAAAALRAGGAKAVAVVTIGRHLNRAWAGNDLRLRSLMQNSDATCCPVCAGDRGLEAAYPATR